MSEQPSVPESPVAPAVEGPKEETATVTPFAFDEPRKFELYMEQRKGYTQGARDAYQRFDQTIVALSGGSIVLSITFMKDIGHIPQSLPWLFASWGFFLVARLCAFISLLTSGEADRERRAQLDCLVEPATATSRRLSASAGSRWALTTGRSRPAFSG